MSTLEKIFKFARVLTFYVKLEKWSFHVVDLPRTKKTCTKIKKKAREGRANVLFLLIKYANFVESFLPLLRRSVACVPNTTARDQYMAKLKMV